MSRLHLRGATTQLDAKATNRRCSNLLNALLRGFYIRIVPDPCISRLLATRCRRVTELPLRSATNDHRIQAIRRRVSQAGARSLVPLDAEFRESGVPHRPVH